MTQIYRDITKQLSTTGRKRYVLAMTFRFHNSFYQKFNPIDRGLTPEGKYSLLFSGFAWKNKKPYGTDPTRGSIAHMLWRRDERFYKDCGAVGLISSEDECIYSNNINKDIAEYLEMVYKNNTMIEFTHENLEVKISYCEQVATIVLDSFYIKSEEKFNEVLTLMKENNEEALLKCE